MEKQKFHRRSIRLKQYSYQSPGLYFITICTHEYKCLFGKIVEGEMRLNDIGNVMSKWYFEIENKFFNMRCDEHIIMPNHVHMIIEIVNTYSNNVKKNVGADPNAIKKNVGADLCVCPGKLGGHTGPPVNRSNLLGGHIGPPLHTAIQWFKTMTTNAYIRGIKQHNWRSFHTRLWQRNYFEHIIRHQISLEEIREYIINNPKKWECDKHNKKEKICQ